VSPVKGQAGQESAGFSLIQKTPFQITTKPSRLSLLVA
jgi:hypothetical protein